MIVLGGFAIKEDDLLEKAIDGLAFQFIRKCVIAMPRFRESFIAFATVDTLIKNFIAHLSNQVNILLNIVIFFVCSFTFILHLEFHSLVIYNETI